MKKYILLILFSFCFFITNVSAINTDIKSNNVLLYNLKDNEILYEKNSNENTYIASLTKIVTVLVAIENINDVDEVVTLAPEVFKDLAELNASVAGFNPYEKVTYKDLLYGSMLPSGADATRALAINIFGSEKDFVSKMNDLMKKLNIKNTHFTNTSGLDEEGQKATLNDLLTIILYALDNKVFVEIFNSRTYTTNNERLILKSTLDYYEKNFGLNTEIILGGKTGYTDLAGLCLLSYAKNNDTELLLITTNAPVDQNRYPYNVTDALNIYNYYFDNYDYYNILNKNDTVTTIKSKYSKDKYANLIYKDDDFKYLLPINYKESDLSYTFDILDNVSFLTNIKKPIGIFTINYKGSDIFKGNLFLYDNIDFNLLVFIKNHYIISLITLFSLIFVIKRKKGYNGSK